MQNADLHFSASDLCVYEREFVCVRQRERVFQNQVEIEKVNRERERAEEMIRNELEKEKEGRQRKGVGYVCGGEKKRNAWMIYGVKEK